MVLKPVDHNQPDPKRCEYFKKYANDPLHYSTLQRGLRYFDSESGFLAYKELLGHKIALTPAVSTPSSQHAIMSEFIMRNKRVILCNLDENTAGQVHNTNLRYQFAPMGSENVVDISRFLSEESTARKKLVLGALKHAKKHNFLVEEFNPKSEPTDNIEKLVEISNVFVHRSKIGSEMTFINRPLDIYCMDEARYFKLRNGSGLFGIAVIDPYGADLEQNGYLLNIIRFSPTKQWGVYISVVHSLCEVLANEGVRELSLGISPLDSKLLPADFPQSLHLSRMVDSLYARRYHLFLSQSLEKIKRDISDIKKHRYLAIRTPWLYLGLAALMKSMDVSITRSIVKTIV